MRWLLRLYPRAWRERYGPELETTLEDAAPTFVNVLDVIVNALRVRLTPRRRWRPAPVSGGWRAHSGRLPGPSQDMRRFNNQQLVELTRVVPVAQRQVIGSVSLTLLSVEIYADGTIAQFLIAERRRATEAPNLFGVPQFRVTLSDDQATDYASRSYGGSGGSSGPLAPLAQWRMAFAFTPAAPVAARLLTLRVDGVGWRGDRDASGQLSETKRTDGSLEYVVHLE